MLHYHNHAGHLHALLESNTFAVRTVAQTVAFLRALRHGPSGMVGHPVYFDTVVVTGLSGTLLGLSVATALDVNLAVVRQWAATHSSRMVEGRIGERWILVDDLICSGDTLYRVVENVFRVAPQSVLVGAYCYCDLLSAGGPWTSRGELEERFGLARTFPIPFDAPEKKDPRYHTPSNGKVEIGNFPSFDAALYGESRLEKAE